MLAAVSRPSRRGDLLSGRFHLTGHHQNDRLSERLLQADADLLMYTDNALMRIGRRGRATALDAAPAKGYTVTDR